MPFIISVRFLTRRKRSQWSAIVHLVKHETLLHYIFCTSWTSRINWGAMTTASGQTIGLLQQQLQQRKMGEEGRKRKKRGIVLRWRKSTATGAFQWASEVITEEIFALIPMTNLYIVAEKRGEKTSLSHMKSHRRLSDSFTRFVNKRGRKRLPSKLHHSTNRSFKKTPIKNKIKQRNFCSQKRASHLDASILNYFVPKIYITLVNSVQRANSPNCAKPGWFQIQS